MASKKQIMSEHEAHGAMSEHGGGEVAEEEDYEHHLVILAAVTLSMLMLSLICGHIVGHKFKITWIPEAGVVLLVGMFFGAILQYTDTDFAELHTFKTELVGFFATLCTFMFV